MVAGANGRDLSVSSQVFHWPQTSTSERMQFGQRRLPLLFIGCCRPGPSASAWNYSTLGLAGSKISGEANCSKKIRIS